MIKNQQISPWSFYNDYAGALPVDIEEASSKKIKSQLLPNVRKRVSSMMHSTNDQKQSQAKMHKKMSLSQVSSKNVYQNASNQHKLDSTNQSTAKRQQQSHIDFQAIKDELQTSLQNALVVHLIYSQLKQQKNNQAFLQLQKDPYRQIDQQIIKHTQELKLPKIEQPNKSHKIVSYKFAEEMQRKPVELTNELLQEVLKHKIKAILSHKMKALGTRKQIVPRSHRPQSLFLHY